MNSPLAIPNNSTIFAHELHFFHILAPLAPFPQDWGLSFSPKHFPTNFFRNFFQSAKATFFCIFGAKNYGGRRHLSLPKWGGWVSCWWLSIYQTDILSSCSLLLLPESGCLPAPSWQIFKQSGQNRAKSNIFLPAFI